MKKVLLFAAVFVLAIGSGIGQQVFYSGFETWDDVNTPTNWIGAATSITLTDVDQYTSVVEEGTYAMQINNDTTAHKRVSTKPVSVTAGEVYNVSYYVRGTGEIRSTIYRGVTGSYTAYSSYAVINSTTYTKVTQTLICDTTSATAEFVLSVRNTTAANDHLQVDSFEVTIGSSSSVSIHDIQYTTDVSGNSPYFGSPVNTGGIVSAKKTGAYWIQSGTGPWSGVYVYDNVNVPAIGDSVTFAAIVDEYYSLTELKSVSSFVTVSSGNPVPVTGINIPDASAEMYEGVLVKVTNAVCESLPDSYLEWVVGDGMSTLKVGDLIYAYTPTIGTHYDITGVMDYSYDERKIQPRAATDVTLYNAIDEVEVSAYTYPNPATENVTIEADMTGSISISDMTGRVVYSGNFNSIVSVNVSDMAPGLYTISLMGENGNYSTSKLMVK